MKIAQNSEREKNKVHSEGTDIQMTSKDNQPENMIQS
jgi:hypothetical protein